jgi:hypothetical protein
MSCSHWERRETNVWQAFSNGSPQKCDQIRGLVRWPVLFATRMFIRLGCLAAGGGTWRNMKEHKGTQGDMKLQPLSCGGCSSSFRIDIYIYIHTFINTHMHTYIYICIFMCMCVHTSCRKDCLIVHKHNFLPVDFCTGYHGYMAQHVKMFPLTFICTVFLRLHIGWCSRWVPLIFSKDSQSEKRSEIDYSLSELKWVEHVEATADCWLLCCSTLGVCDPELTPTLGGDLSKDPKKDP